MNASKSSGEQSPKPKAFSLTFDHPDQGTHVPLVFTVQGTYSLSKESTIQVKCVATYAGGSKSQCRLCYLDTTALTWCCQFDLSADPPAVNDFLVVTATLLVNGTPAIAQSKNFVFDPAAMDQYTCPQPGTSC